MPRKFLLSPFTYSLRVRIDIFKDNNFAIEISNVRKARINQRIVSTGFRTENKCMEITSLAVRIDLKSAVRLHTHIEQSVGITHKRMLIATGNYSYTKIPSAHGTLIFQKHIILCADTNQNVPLWCEMVVCVESHKVICFEGLEMYSVSCNVQRNVCVHAYSCVCLCACALRQSYVSLC